MTLRNHRYPALRAALAVVTAACVALAMTRMFAQVQSNQTKTPTSVVSKRAALPPSDPILEKALKADPMVRELMGLSQLLMSRALAPDAKFDELIAAYRSGDELAVMELFGFSASEAAAMKERLSALGKDLMARYPEIKAFQIAKKDCPECGVTRAVRILEARRSLLRSTSVPPKIALPTGATVRSMAAACVAELTESGPYSTDGAEPVPPATMEEEEVPEGCPWLYYTAALVLCTLAGPIFYWACAIIAYCELCEGSVRDAFCEFPEIPAIAW